MRGVWRIRNWLGEQRRRQRLRRAQRAVSRFPTVTGRKPHELGAPLIVTLARLLQGFGAAAGIVIARASVRDLYSGVEAARFFSALMLVTGLGPILAPVIGGQVLAGPANDQVGTGDVVRTIGYDPRHRVAD